MSIYFEEARKFGQLLLTSEQAVRLADANAIFEESEQAKEKMRLFNAYQANIQESINQGSMQESEMQLASKNMSEMIAEMKQDPVIGAVLTAESEFNAFMNQVMGVLRLTVSGKPLEENGGCSGCSGGSSCSGCN